MKFAVIADIHGNLDALLAVLADIKQEGVDQIIKLGDHFSGPLDPLGTADALLHSDMISIRGNHDRWLLEQSIVKMGPSDRVAASQINDEHKAWLAKLPSSLTLENEIFACHGTPDSDLVYWMETIGQDGLASMASKEHIEAIASDIPASLLLCGHTHIPRLVRLTDGRLLLNPGSVGCPAYDDTAPVYHIMQTGIPDAMYAIVHKRQDQWTASIKNVPYDSTRMIALAREYERPDWASAVEAGWLMGP